MMRTAKSISNQNTEMTFIEHLAELRHTLIMALAGVVVGSILSFVWADLLFKFITTPFNAAFPDARLIGTGPAEAFLLKIKLAITFGFIISTPHTFFQLWKFISPGLKSSEQKFALPFVFLTTACFLTGVAFCFYVVFPFALEFFYAEFLELGLDSMIRISEYFSFALRLLIIFGAIFELPVLSLILARLKLLHHSWLIKWGRYSVIIIFIVAAILTPPDPISQLLLAGPLLLIYAICIGIAYVANPNSKQNKESV